MHHHFSSNTSEELKKATTHRLALANEASGWASDSGAQWLVFRSDCHSLSVWLYTIANLSVLQVSHLCNAWNSWNTYFMNLLWKLNELLHVKHLGKPWACSKRHGNVGCYYYIIIIVILNHPGWELQCLFGLLDSQCLSVLLLEYLFHFQQPPPYSRTLLLPLNLLASLLQFTPYTTRRSIFMNVVSIELFSYSETYNVYCYSIWCEFLLLGQEVLSVQPQHPFRASSPSLAREGTSRRTSPLTALCSPSYSILRAWDSSHYSNYSSHSNTTCPSWASSNFVSSKDCRADMKGTKIKSQTLLIQSECTYRRDG